MVHVGGWGVLYVVCVYMVCVSGVGRGMRAVYAVCLFGGVCLRMHV